MGQIGSNTCCCCPPILRLLNSGPPTTSRLGSPASRSCRKSWRRTDGSLHPTGTRRCLGSMERCSLAFGIRMAQGLNSWNLEHFHLRYIVDSAVTEPGLGVLWCDLG